MAAWQRLSAGAACAGLAAPCPQFPRLSTSRSVGLYNLCSGMCRGSGLFPCEESRVLPRTRHRSPRLSQQLRSSLHSSLPPPRSPHRVRLSMSRTSDKPSAQKQNTFPWRGRKKPNKPTTTKIQSAFCSATLAFVALLSPVRGIRSRGRRSVLPGPGASAEHPARLTPAPRDRLLPKSEGTVTLFLAEHH